MNAPAGILRGPAASRVLGAFGIHARRYWLLMDLFRHLSENRDMFSQLGRDDTSLKVVTFLYFGIASLASVVAVLTRASLHTYFYTALGYSTFVVLSILLPETSNSLVNPVEGLVLAHQPINGATYTAAKLSHLLRIVVYLEGGLNAVPALAGSLLPNAPSYYPLVHLGSALALGLLSALACCAVFGWLIRFLPARRLKAAGQMAEIAPWMVLMLRDPLRELLAAARIPQRAAALAELGSAFAIACGVLATAVVALGIRALSGDYLVRVSSLVHGRGAAKSKPRRSLLESAIARWCGGPPSRAGFAFVSKMMVRDWFFRRQMLPILVVLLGPVFLAGRGLLVSPFSPGFAPLHFLPHFCGFMLFQACALLAYGNDHKGAWLFLLAPAHAVGGFAQGVFASLWIRGLVIPHAVLLAVLVPLWGIWQAPLFLAYSLAASSFYLALELRLINGVPFGRPPDPTQNASLFGVMIAGGAGMALAVGLQYFLVFHSPAIVMLAAALLGAGAYLVTRTSLHAFEESINFHLAEVSGQYGRLYHEV